MSQHQSSLNIICLETEAFYSLIEEVVERMTDKEEKKDEQWIEDTEAMKLLGIKSKTTLQKFRDNGSIRFSLIGAKLILYDRDSIMAYIESKAKDTF